jgi:hypothetical protein
VAEVEARHGLRSENAHYRMAHIQRRHWNGVAKANGLGEDFEPVIQQFIAQTPRVVEAVLARLPAGFPSAVSEPIFNGLLAQISGFPRRTSRHRWRSSYPAPVATATPELCRYFAELSTEPVITC